MPSRITQSMLSRSALADVTYQRLRLADTQRQASSGLRISRPADDPAGTATAHLLKTGLAATSQYLRNVEGGLNRVSVAESAVGSATDLIIRAKELALAGATDTQDAESRRALADEIESLHAALLGEANASNARGYVFAGFAADVQPFVASGPFVDTPPTAPTVAYAGDSQEARIAIDDGVDVKVGFDGRRIFMGDADGDGNPDPGREDIFQVLSDLWSALRADDGAATAGMLPRLDRAAEQLTSARSEMGAAAETLQRFAPRLEQREVDLQGRLSEVQDADLATVVSQLVQQETALQAGLASMARIITPSLLDFLA